MNFLLQRYFSLLGHATISFRAFFALAASAVLTLGFRFLLPMLASHAVCCLAPNLESLFVQYSLRRAVYAAWPPDSRGRRVYRNSATCASRHTAAAATMEKCLLPSSIDRRDVRFSYVYYVRFRDFHIFVFRDFFEIRRNTLCVEYNNIIELHHPA